MEPLALGSRVLNRYRVEELRAEGGHSVIYRGLDERLLRQVCIKVFCDSDKEDTPPDSSYYCFLQEAYALSKLTHPNTLRIYDVGHLDGADGPETGPPFQVSEYMQGGTLQTEIRRCGPLDLESVTRIVTALCGALNEAHEQNIIHRDIKPRNILFGPSGIAGPPKLADFSIATARPGTDTGSLPWDRTSGQAQASGHSLIMYSVYWAAPEQLAVRPLDRTVDLYALALLIVFMLTGKPVFEHRDKHRAYQERLRVDRRIHALLADLNQATGLEALLARACSFDPRQRIRNAEQFAEAFVRAGRPGKPGRFAPLSAGEEPVVRNRPGLDRLMVVELPLSPSRPTRPFGERTARLLPLCAGSADLEVPSSPARLRLSLLDSGEPSPVLHIRGLNCFVGNADHRTSSAIQLEKDSEIELFCPASRTTSRLAVFFGKRNSGRSVFSIEGQAVEVTADIQLAPVALDFGPGSSCYFLSSPEPEDKIRKTREGSPG